MQYVPDPAYFAGKYRVASARRPGGDYGQTGAYCITICTAGRHRFFGEIAELPHPHLVGTRLAQAAVDCWLAIPDYHSYATPGAFVVMPDHVHGLVLLHRPDDAAAYQPPAFGPQKQNLAAVVRGFKAAVTKWSIEQQLPFGWQSRFHDRIVRNDDELARLEWYIEQNPIRWAAEHNQPDNIFR